MSNTADRCYSKGMQAAEYIMVLPERLHSVVHQLEQQLGKVSRRHWKPFSLFLFMSEVKRV